MRGRKALPPEASARQQHALKALYGWPETPEQIAHHDNLREAERDRDESEQYPQDSAE